MSDLVARLEALEARVTDQDQQLETAELAKAALQAENQELRDEIARLKNLPPRPPFKPSGMEKATEQAARKPGAGPRRRGPKRDKDRVSREEVLTAQAPSGSRFKGYETILVRELILSAELVRYRRECWLTPEGQRIIAPLPDGVLGGFGANLRRFCLVMHAQGQVTTERLTAILNAIGVAISKRQVVRLLTAKLETFLAEDSTVFEAGLRGSAYITVDDTGARHARKACFTTQFGSPRFTTFRTGPSKSRLAFLRNLMCGTARYAINAAALAYMRTANLAHGVIEALQGAKQLRFADQAEWMAHLRALGLTELRVNPDPIRVASEAALWGAVQAEGLLAGAVIVSDDAGQFRVGEHALCWVHAERLVHKLLPANHVNATPSKSTRPHDLVALPASQKLQARAGRKRPSTWPPCFDRIFGRKTGYATLDNLLKRLRGRRPELLRVLERPEIPLNTNSSENDIRCVVTKRKISGGTISEKGRNARDVMLGLAKTCAKLGLSFWHYLGDRLGLNPGAARIPPLADLVAGHTP